MRSLAELLGHLRELHVRIWRENESLHLDAPTGRLTPALRREISERKAEILSFLHTAAHVSQEGTFAIVPALRTGNVPLSFAQERLWFLDQLEGQDATYNIPIVLLLEGQLRVDILKQSLTEVVQRHEILRTTFSVVDGLPIQVIENDPDIPFSFLCFEESSDPEQAEIRQQFIEQDIQKPFDLEKGPLFRVTLVRLSPGQHWLVIVMHHIISDGWSMDIFIHELSAFYQAFIAGNPSSLSPLPIQYADFAIWQKQWLQGEVLASQLKYWKTQLASIPILLDLPTDHPRPARQSFQGAVERFHIDPPLTQQLRSLSQKSGVTLFMTLLTAYAVLLARYSRQDDLVIGTPIANRHRQEIEPLIGFFANTLPMRIRLSGSLSFQKLLQRVREDTLDAYNHQDIPFERLVEVLQPERHLSHTPLFQVMFSLQHTPTAVPDFAEISVTSVPVHTGTSKFDMTLALEETPNKINGVCEYNTDLFEASTILRMLGHLQTILQGIITDPVCAIAQLPLLTQAEQQYMLTTWNATQNLTTPIACVQQLFDAQVERTPEAIAVVCMEQSLTYRELQRKANCLAEQLKQRGVGPDVLVGISIERSLDMLVGVLGILKAGGAYLPLEPSFPAPRLAFMLQDAGVSILLTQQHLLNALPPHQAQVLVLEAYEDDETQSRAYQPSEVTLEHLAYVMYTSGSTGRPKGVQIPHRALTNFLHSMRRTPGFTAQDVLLAVTTLSFDISGLELFLPLLVGGKIVLATADMTIDGVKLAQTIQQQGVTVMQATPATWRLLIESGWQGQNTLKALCGGESLPPDLASKLLNRVGSLWNMYGPTETTIWSAVYQVKDRNLSIPLGKPIDNTSVFVLDEFLTPVPIGAPGELYIGGHGVARGYLGRPELTAEKFMPDPFGGQAGARVYKTGDLVRFLPDGTLEFLGRMDSQVKIRGFRIELGEIETILSQHQAIRDAVVVAREDRDGEKRLIAYFAAEGSPRPSANELRNAVRQQVPDYMVPSFFIALERFPLTPNGKIDRKALPDPELVRTELSETYQGPRTPIEQELCAIWAEVLGRKRIGIKENFFTSGGHSLLAVRLLTQIQKKFNQQIPLTVLFQEATIESIAHALTQSSLQNDAHTLVVPMQPNGEECPFFWIHPAGGHLFCYADLARNMGRIHPLYGIQAPGLYTAEQGPLHSIEEIAAYYLPLLQDVQPEGPYLLGGWSLGGVIAFEMAQQFQQQGHDVALLALVDSWIPTEQDEMETWMNTYDEARLLKEFLQQFGSRVNSSLSLPDEDFRALSAPEQRQAIFEQLLASQIVPVDLNLEQMLRFFDVFKVNLNAIFTYRPQQYTGKITFFQAQERLSEESGPSGANWNRYTAQPVKIYEIPGNHYSMLSEPFVHVLATQLQACLNHARSSAWRGTPNHQIVEVKAV